MYKHVILMYRFGALDVVTTLYMGPIIKKYEGEKLGQAEVRESDEARRAYTGWDKDANLAVNTYRWAEDTHLGKAAVDTVHAVDWVGADIGGKSVWLHRQMENVAENAK